MLVLLRPLDRFSLCLEAAQNAVDAQLRDLIKAARLDREALP
jgi:hypothetical protein